MAALYRALSQIAVTWRVALISAVVAVACLAVTTWALGAYIRRAGSASLAGAAGTVVLGTSAAR